MTGPELCGARFVQIVVMRSVDGIDDLICLDADGNIWRLEGSRWQRLTDERELR